MPQRFALPVVALFALGVTMYLYAINDLPESAFWSEFRFQVSPDAAVSPQWWVTCALVGTMLLGLVFGSLYELLQTRDTRGDAPPTVNVAALFADMLKSRQFWLAVLAAPFALFLIPSFKTGPTGSVEHYAFAFQNGFFVKALIPAERMPTR